MVFSGMNWQNVGIEAVRIILTSSFTLLVAALLFRRHIAPEFIEALEDAKKAATTLASLGGLKKAEYTDGRSLDKIVSADILKKQIPELEALKLFLDAETWEKIEDAIEENPAAVMQLYEKWKHLIPGASQSTEKTDF